MMCHYPDPGSASDWLKQVSLAARPIRITTQIQVVTHHQYGRFVLVPETSFRTATRGGIAKFWLFSQPIWLQLVINLYFFIILYILCDLYVTPKSTGILFLSASELTLVLKYFFQVLI